MIETERLILRPFQESDAEDVYEYLREPAVNLHSGDGVACVFGRIPLEAGE